MDLLTSLDQHTAQDSSFSVSADRETTHLPTSRRKVSKTIEERYQKKTPIEHVLHRPESYIGSVQPDSQSVWVWDDQQQKMVFKTVTFVPGLYKIFDEILVNAADVKARERGSEEATRSGRSGQRMTCLKVDIDRANGVISVYNDGAGIPVEIHKEHQIYVPELIFGHLLTSDNYDDSEQRITGGRNGYGAKLTNIFSTSFTVECGDATRKRKFKKLWKNNMGTSQPCEITNYNESKDFVRVTFVPDLSRFQVASLDADFVALLTKRVYDVAGCCGLRVWLNGSRLPVDNFKSYVDLYFPNSGESNGSTESTAKPPIKIHEKSDRWEVVVSMSLEGQFQQVSFVNSIATTKGGTHVNYVAEPLIQAILKKVNSRNKGGLELKTHHVKAHLWLFVNALIVNPTFDSQTKETLTLKASQFGSKFVLSDRTVNTVIKSEIVDSILLWAKTKQQVELQRKMKGSSGRGGRDRITGIPKLEDANDAGTKHSDQCTLILTEGESAKTSCIAGLSVVGRDRYGVFPLRGKLLNVREASFKQQIENQEIQAILKIMGLQVGKQMDTPRGLRYGSLMIMTDQDLDGSHIKGLLINMIAHYWPHLLQYRGFLREFVTPIVKVSRKKEKLSFFTLAEYDAWKQENNGGKGWVTRYYKGLGTSSDQEFKEYFTALDRHTLDFLYSGEEDIQAIDMAFNAKRAEDRKQWIQNYQEGDYIDHTQATVTYTDFINKELVVFSKYDVVRSIPNCIDGLKPVQRKVLYAAFKRNLKNEIKVAQFTGYISEITSYHHGEQSLGTTVIGMAQKFVGSNNLNLLEPCGQFGSRKEGGKDASAVRYILTRLAPVTRALFPEADDALLDYQNDDGLLIEPKYYVPIIPFALVNGVEGIGTGWSSSIPNYNPRDLIANVRKFMRGEPMDLMTPWYKGFCGRVERKPGGYESVGTIQKLDDETLVVTELPVKVWTQSFKQFLESLLSTGNESAQNHSSAGGLDDSTADNVVGPGRSRNGSSRPASTTTMPSFTIVDYRDNSSHETIHFTIKVTKSTMQRLEREGLEKAFKLRKPIPTTNMTLFDSAFKVQRYATELDIIRDFGQLRLQLYELRLAYLIEKLERECRILHNKVRFISDVIAQRIIISNRKREAIIVELLEKKYDPITDIHKASNIIWKLEKQREALQSEAQAPAEDGSNDDDNETDTRFANSHLVKNESHSTRSQQPPRLMVPAKEFEYLLGMSFWSLTLEKIQELERLAQEKRVELESLQRVKPEDLWEADLVHLEEILNEQDAQDAARKAENTTFIMHAGSTSRRGRKGHGATRGRPAAKRGVRPGPTAQRNSRDSSESNSLGTITSDDLSDNSSDSSSPPQPRGRVKSKGARTLTTLTSSTSTNPTAPRKAWNLLEATAKTTETPTTETPESSAPGSFTSLADRIRQRAVSVAYVYGSATPLAPQKLFHFDSTKVTSISRTTTNATNGSHLLAQETSTISTSTLTSASSTPSTRRSSPEKTARETRKRLTRPIIPDSDSENEDDSSSSNPTRSLSAEDSPFMPRGKNPAPKTRRLRQVSEESLTSSAKLNDSLPATSKTRVVKPAPKVGGARRAPKARARGGSRKAAFVNSDSESESSVSGIVSSDETD